MARMKSIFQNNAWKIAVPACIVIAAGVLLYKRKWRNNALLNSKEQPQTILTEKPAFVEDESSPGSKVAPRKEQKGSTQENQYLNLNPALLIRKLSDTDDEFILDILEALAIQTRNDKIQEVVAQIGGLKTLCELCGKEDNPDILFRILYVLMNFSVRQNYLTIFADTHFLDTLFRLLDNFSDASLSFDRDFMGSSSHKVLQFALLCVQNITFNPDGCSLYPTDRAVSTLLSLRQAVPSKRFQELNLVSESIEKCLLHYQLSTENANQ